MEQLVIYKFGETHIQTTITNGFCDYTNGKRPERYLDELGPGYACLPFGQAVELIEQAESEKYLKPWEEINEDDYDYWLSVLPPEKWQTVDGVNIFRLCEYQTSNITRHCATYNGRYFTANRRTSNKYKALAEEVKLIYQKGHTMKSKREKIKRI